VTTRLEYDEQGVPRHMQCELCEARARFDWTLPFVDQTSAFTTGHDCAARSTHDTWSVPSLLATLRVDRRHPSGTAT